MYRKDRLPRYELRSDATDSVPTFITDDFRRGKKDDIAVYGGARARRDS